MAKLITPERFAEIEAQYKKQSEKFGEHAWLSPSLRAIGELLDSVRYLACSFTCTWCKTKWLLNSEQERAAFLMDHVTKCSAHPVARVAAENDRMRIELEILRARLAERQKADEVAK
jgi:hypothetical protein